MQTQIPDVTANLMDSGPTEREDTHQGDLQSTALVELDNGVGGHGESGSLSLALSQTQANEGLKETASNGAFNLDIWFEIFDWWCLSNQHGDWCYYGTVTLRWLCRCRIISRDFETVVRPIIYRSMAFSERSLRRVLDIPMFKLAPLVISNLRLYGKNLSLPRSIPTSLLPGTVDLVRKCSWNKIHWPLDMDRGYTSKNGQFMACFLAAFLDTHPKSTILVVDWGIYLAATTQFPDNGLLLNHSVLKVPELDENNREIVKRGDDSAKQLVKELIINDRSHGAFCGFMSTDFTLPPIKRLTVDTDCRYSMELHKTLDLSILEHLSIYGSSLSALIDDFCIPNLAKLRILQVRGGICRQFVLDPLEYRSRMQQILRSKSAQYIEMDCNFRDFVLPMDVILYNCPCLRLLNFKSLHLSLPETRSGTGIQLDELRQLRGASPKGLYYLGDVEIRDEIEIDEVFATLGSFEQLHTVTIIMLNGFWFDDWEERLTVGPDYNRAMEMMQRIQRLKLGVAYRRIFVDLTMTATQVYKISGTFSSSGEVTLEGIEREPPPTADYMDWMTLGDGFFVDYRW